MSDAGAFGDGEREHELRRVQDLDRQAPADLDLGRVLRVERGIRAQTAGCCPVAHGIRTVLLQDVGGGDNVALGLGHLLAVRVDDESRDRGISPRRSPVLERAAKHRREQPRPDDVLSLGTQVERCDKIPELGIALPAAGELGSQGRGRPGVEDVTLAVEAARDSPLVRGVAGRHVGGGVDGKLVVRREQDAVVVALTVLIEGVPDRDRHAEESLA